jgi:hypothetical protein
MLRVWICELVDIECHFEDVGRCLPVNPVMVGDVAVIAVLMNHGDW